MPPLPRATSQDYPRPCLDRTGPCGTLRAEADPCQGLRALGSEATSDERGHEKRRVGPQLPQVKAQRSPIAAIGDGGVGGTPGFPTAQQSSAGAALRTAESEDEVLTHATFRLSGARRPPLR